tara:strand:- start:104 stop:691 length:588 start_codon:yes stop_codon:yes gene_type:complete
MRFILITIFLILSFQSLTKADDVRDFEIEGMSIGDSLLDHFSEEEIKKELSNKYYYAKSTEFFQVSFYIKNQTDYDFVQFHLKDNDTNYEIYSVTGVIVFNNDIESCLKKMNKIKSEVNDIFINAKKVDKGKSTHNVDSKSFVYESFYELNNGQIYLACYDWSEKMTKENGWLDNFKLSIDSKEFKNWLYSPIIK